MIGKKVANRRRGEPESKLTTEGSFRTATRTNFKDTSGIQSAYLTLSTCTLRGSFNGRWRYGAFDGLAVKGWVRMFRSHAPGMYQSLGISRTCNIHLEAGTVKNIRKSEVFDSSPTPSEGRVCVRRGLVWVCEGDRIKVCSCLLTAVPFARVPTFHTYRYE